KETYQVYQDVLFAIKSKDKTKFDEIISNSYTNISTYMITSLNTLKEYKEYIHNTIDSNLTNGKMEGNNNLIKVIKRIAFGFRSFRRFKARIMIIVGLLKPNKKELRIWLLNSYFKFIYHWWFWPHPHHLTKNL
ncbi:MAG: transposase, partial [Malacoplasma sp.]